MLEQCGYRRHEIGRLTRAYVARVLFHPRDRDGKIRLEAYQRPGPRPREESPLESLTREYRVRGWPEHRARAEARRLQAAYEGMDGKGARHGP